MALADTAKAAEAMKLIARRMPKADWKAVGAQVWREIAKNEAMDAEAVAEKVASKWRSDR